MLESLKAVLLPLLFGEGAVKSPQQNIFSNLGNLGNLVNDAYRQLLSSYDPENYEKFYHSSFVSPVKRTLQEEILPQIKSQFLSSGELGSSALNKALSQSIQQAALRLGEGLLGGYNQAQSNHLQTLGQLLAAWQQKPQNSPAALGGLFGGLLEEMKRGLGGLSGHAGAKAGEWIANKLFNAGNS